MFNIWQLCYSPDARLVLEIHSYGVTVGNYAKQILYSTFFFPYIAFFLIICTFTFLLCSPELEKGLKKRVKLHAYENGENGQTASRENGQHAQNEDIDSDDNYTEVRRNQPLREGVGL